MNHHRRWQQIWRTVQVSGHECGLHLDLLFVLIAIKTITQQLDQRLILLCLSLSVMRYLYLFVLSCSISYILSWLTSFLVMHASNTHACMDARAHHVSGRWDHIVHSSNQTFGCKWASPECRSRWCAGHLGMSSNVECLRPCNMRRYAHTYAAIVVLSIWISCFLKIRLMWVLDMLTCVMMSDTTVSFNIAVTWSLRCLKMSVSGSFWAFLCLWRMGGAHRKEHGWVFSLARRS